LYASERLNESYVQRMDDKDRQVYQLRKDYDKLEQSYENFKLQTNEDASDELVVNEQD
jgi:hypothetical protein